MREARNVPLLAAALWLAHVPLSGVRVRRVTPDSLGAVVTLNPGRPGGGTTGLALQAGRLRLALSASVRPRR